ncbi:nitrogenase stabilizing/protective protein NifW [Trinickia caryophylli]|uniref:Nitrogenase-stabilizing/protective protein NifW n=1 Tax=Trinickia caryophylli TaxID=28094 RepID=A0A1X7EFJ7_TRICW|nr:nitrogenase stabilizing/protective protein NifW [Trinickia caryophylli]PMS11102.1 nitrogenase stabilizing/protective protein NifW [Trinickia caryophylli]TRX14557.1 nitrogenase stabilizing/protective protein NifW [Trinickia caryophylli]WQE14396.1 nitrogenase stabilizing/protective protein NifW [Trinickia caryophylli]SMF33085.1 nitrogenase-stabilizing/protective protein [Trinickia caryophylli]GLU32206.1 nitrogenase-stabilizing/protective protein NifW [Trinickia caryophylli]
MTHLAERMKTLSSAEDFLQFFGVLFDQKVVDVCRLHILKRFFQYIRQQTVLPHDNEVALFTAYHDLLVRAYGDFVESTPADEKVFKVFQDVGGRQHVSVDNLRASLPARDAA